MTDAQLDDLSQRLAEEEGNPFTPQCVARAFLAEPSMLGPIQLLPLTMRGYLRLESARSPYVTGMFPEDNAERLQALCFAVAVLSGRGWTIEELVEELTPEQAIEGDDLVADCMARVWETALPMRRPAKAGEGVEPPARDHGFGWWVRVLTKLVVDLGFTRDEALDCPMAQAFALVATNAALDGMEPKEMNYREREAAEKAEGEKRKAEADSIHGVGEKENPAEDEAHHDENERSHGGNIA